MSATDAIVMPTSGPLNTDSRITNLFRNSVQPARTARALFSTADTVDLSSCGGDWTRIPMCPKDPKKVASSFLFIHPASCTRHRETEARSHPLKWTSNMGDKFTPDPHFYRPCHIKMRHHICTQDVMFS